MVKVRWCDWRNSVSGYGESILAQLVKSILTLTLSRSRRAALRAEPGYRLVSPNMKFDYLEGRGSSYRMRLRVVRIAVGGGRFENLATNLDREACGPGELGEVYALRWGIETACFRQ